MSGAPDGGGLPALAIRRPVATVVVYLIVVVLGAGSLRFLPVDLLPAVDFARLTVFVNYPDVGPEEVETLITDKLENALSGIANLERITSQTEEGRSRVSLEFGRGTDLGEAANDVRAALDQLRDTLPLDADSPGIWKFDPNAREVVTLSAVSTLHLERLTRLLEREVAQSFKQIPGVGAVTVSSGIYREVQVQLMRDRLNAMGISAEDVRQTLLRENVRAPGGNIKTGMNDLYVRTLGEFSSVRELEDVVVAEKDGVPVRLSAVGRVVDGYEEVRQLAELDGVPSVRLEIQKQSGANTVDVAERIRAVADRVNASRDDVRLTVIQDQSTFIQASMASVVSAAGWGGLLALLVLFVFLRNPSATLIIGTSIPISIVASFALLYFGGSTLNQMTFGGLALGIGLMVDNAIVVLESIVRHRQERGHDEKQSARRGTSDVAGAITASTLTTCVIFLPVVFMQSISGQLFRALAVVVVFALACSLAVALTLVPMLSSRFLKASSVADDPQQGFARLERGYAALLGLLLRRRGWVYLGAIGLTAGAMALWPLVSIELTPPTDTDEIDVEITMAQGINLAVTKSYLSELEQIVRPLLPDDDLSSVSTEVRTGGDAEVEIRMKAAAERQTDTSALADRLRAAVQGQIPGAEIEVQAQSGLWILRRLFSSSGGDQDIEIQIRGHDLERARRLAERMRKRIAQLPAIADAKLEDREGKPERRLAFDRRKLAALGLSVAEVSAVVQTSVAGTEAGTFREEGEEYPIVVRLRPEDRVTVEDVDDVPVRTPSGEVVLVGSLLKGTDATGPMEIRHVNGQRVTFLSANLEEGVALVDAVDAIRAAIADIQIPEGFSVQFGGAYEEQEKAEQDFLLTILMALLLVYLVMAAQFERFIDPLVVMASVPLAVVGVVPTLVLTHTTVNLQSLMGMVMLVGIVVNNAIVLIDAINLLRREQGLEVMEAAIEASRLRLRPILMTTATTTLGLFTLALGIGAGAALQASLARVVVGGLLASTGMTLLVIPALYVGAASLGERLRGARQGRARAG